MSPLRRAAPTVSLILAFCLAPLTAFGVIHQVTVTGSVELLEFPPDYSPSDPDPVDGGETFTLTFDFDDAAPLSSSSGSTISSYDTAVSNLSLVLSNGVTWTTAQDGVLAADNGSNHQWSIQSFTGSSGFSSNLPDPLFVFNELGGEDESFGLQAMNFVIFDPTGTAYGSAPPELLLPSSSVFPDLFLDIVWESFDSPGNFVTIVTTVSSLSSTPVASAVPLLAWPTLGVLAFGSMGVGSWLLARRQALR